MKFTLQLWSPIQRNYCYIPFNKTMQMDKEKIKNKESKISQQNHIVEELCENGEIQYNCTACHKTFRSRSQKYYHLNCNQLENKLYKCEHCDKV